MTYPCGDCGGNCITDVTCCENWFHYKCQNLLKKISLNFEARKAPFVTTSAQNAQNCNWQFWFWKIFEKTGSIFTFWTFGSRCASREASFTAWEQQTSRFSERFCLFSWQSFESWLCFRNGFGKPQNFIWWKTFTVSEKWKFLSIRKNNSCESLNHIL